MDKLQYALVGASLLGLGQLLRQSKGSSLDREDTGVLEPITPGIALSDFTSDRYQVSFKYPRGWNINPRYEDKYEGKEGFFEISDFSGIGENIDEAVNAQINELYKPYGSNPTVRSFVIDGQPARVIYPSEDQAEFYVDRDAAIILKYPKPVELDGKTFDYVIIWTTREYVPLILSTFRFIKES